MTPYITPGPRGGWLTHCLDGTAWWPVIEDARAHADHLARWETHVTDALEAAA